MEDITDVDYRHGKTVFECLINTNLGDFMICMFKVIHYCLQMFLKILETCIKVYELDTAHFLSALGLA